MLALFYNGGPLFMGILSLILFALIFSFFLFPTHLHLLGKLGLGLGVLGSLIGLYGAFKGIEKMGGVSQAMLAGGLKNTLLPTLYGLVIYLLSLGLQIGNKKKSD